ncbi:MAG TPA: Rossmann-like and DUF2520 domain-containing protein [Actinomycetota bacterium]|nr:Rossmann-like and DUF2520 domain-containing protein [Actinomycetota bacterium]
MSTTALPSAPLRVALIGAGTVGTAVAHLLAQAGHSTIGVASRSADSARRASQYLDAPVFDLNERIPSADLFLLGVPDHAVQLIARRLSSVVDSSSVVAHFAGVIGVEPLAEVARRGAAAVALHPVQACPDLDTAVARLPGSAWGITTSPTAEVWAARLVREDLRGIPIAVSEDARPLWHAAAAATANGLTALLTISYELLRAAEIESAAEVLAPLASGVLSNALDRGPGDSLTGPIVRGDVPTVQAHLTALGESRELRTAYLHAARLTLSAARLSGRLEPTAHPDLIELLESA